MSIGVADSTIAIETVADLIESLGGIPSWRIRYRPYPGTATESDVLAALEAPRKRICELVDGVLVEKPMSFRESSLAGALISFLRAFVIPRNLGIVTGEQGMMRLFPGLIRAPDVAYVSWSRVPGRQYPTQPIPDLSPDLAVEILSPSNTEAEMDRKLRDYFSAGVSLAWVADPEDRTVRAYVAPETHTEFSVADVLDGGTVLPGFQLRLADWFGELDRHG